MNLTMSAPTHIPVLLEETMEALAVRSGGRYIDCTLGAGGHALAILERSSPGGQLLGIDADPEAITTARARLEAYKGSALLINQNFANLKDTCIKYGFLPVHGILFDLGLSSLQLEGSGRGFSFQRDEPLDMRLSPSQEVNAADILNTTPELELARLIRTLGEENKSRRIAHYIVRERPLKTTLQLVGTIERAVGGRRGRIHPATRTFQALRIAVNHELENLESALSQALDLLGLGGRLVVISYHSLDDRIVKRFMQEEARKASLKLVYKKVVTPSRAEVHFNPRSRSAKLRAAERITIPREVVCGQAIH
jgi:16S rRNA (cytosine1402-N4)-methyltransferase